MVPLKDHEVRSFISMLTKNRENGFTKVIVSRNHTYNNELGNAMAIATEDFANVIPLFNWTEDDVRYYLQPKNRRDIDILDDTEFAFFYTEGRRATWKRTAKADQYPRDKGFKHEQSVTKAMNKEVISNSQK